MDIKDIQSQAAERIWLFPCEHDGEVTLLWGDDPAPGEGMDASEAVEYVRKDVHEAIIKRQANAAKTGMDAAKRHGSHMESEAKRLHAECNPEALESEREANAKLTELVAELERDRDMHKADEEAQIALRQKADELEAALAAHMEQLNYVIVDAKRCAAVLAFPSNYNAADYQSFAKDVMSNIEALSKQNPIASSDNCDLECGAYSTYCKCKAEAPQ